MFSNRSFVAALFPDRESAELGFSALSERGYAQSEIDVLMSEYARHRYFRPGVHDTGLSIKTGKGSYSGSVLRRIRHEC